MHRERPFFASLCAFMSSGPCVTMVLEREGAIARLREIMGATDPAKAAPGTIRKDFAASIERNAIHGSDAPETAAFEIGYFFPGIELRSERAWPPPARGRTRGRHPYAANISRSTAMRLLEHGERESAETLDQPLLVHGADLVEHYVT